MKDWIIIVATIGVIGAFVTLMILAERARRKAIAKAMNDLGLSLQERPDDAARERAFRSLGITWTDLRTAAKGVEWIATGEVEGRPLTIIEHKYTTGSGKNRSTHVHAIASTPAPPQWPQMKLAREGLFDKLGAVFGSRDFSVEDEAFNKRWKVQASSEDFALVVLTPQVQAWAVGLDPATQIRIGGGAITVARRGSASAEKVVDLAKRCAELADLIPAELLAWENP